MFVHISAEAPDDGTVIAYETGAWEELLAAKSLDEVEAALAKNPGKAVPAASFRPVAQTGGDSEKPRRCGDLAPEIYRLEKERASAPRKRPGRSKQAEEEMHVSVWPYRKAGA